MKLCLTDLTSAYNLYRRFTVSKILKSINNRVSLAFSMPCFAGCLVLEQRRFIAWLVLNRVNPPVVRFDDSLQNWPFFSIEFGGNSKIMSSPHVLESISVFGCDDMPLYNVLGQVKGSMHLRFTFSLSPPVFFTPTTDAPGSLGMYAPNNCLSRGERRKLSTF